MENLFQLQERLLGTEKNNESLSRQLQQLYDFINQLTIPIYKIDSQGVISWVNQKLADLLGYSREALIGLSSKEIYESPATMDFLLENIQGGTDKNVHPANMLCKDATVIKVLVGINTQLNDGAIVRVEPVMDVLDAKGDLIGLDISYLKQAEERSGKLAAIVDSSDDAIISKSLEGVIASWNASAERMFGYTADEMIGQPILKIIPPDRQDEEPHILSQLRQGIRVEHFETRRLTKSGSLIDVSLTISPVRDAQGKIIGVSKIARDITSRKQEEQRKADFISMVSHELRTPLTSITAYIQLLLAKALEESDEFSSDALSKAELQLKKMNRMISDFLSMARIEEGKMQVEKEKFLLQSLIDEIAGDAQFLNTKHNIEVLPDTSAMLYADREKIGLVLVNLLINAVKYSPQGGTITVETKRHDNKVTVCVKDQGIGISAENQKHLFDRFFRVNSEKIKTVSGFGIGLYLASEIMAYHNSKIEVESEEGKGSTFYFTLDAV